MSEQESRTGKLAIVTGGASGIGLATVRRLHQDGHAVIIADRADNADTVAQEVSALEAPVYAEKVDLDSPEDIERMTERISASYGAPDILINNAGVHPKREDGGHYSIEEIQLEQWEQVMRINLTSMFLLCQWAMGPMKERGWGRIVNVSSRAGRTYTAISGAHYSASKAAVVGFTRTLAGEVGAYGVTANTVAPGRIKTPLSDVSGLSSSQNLHEAFTNAVPLKRVGAPDELASAISFLSSNDSSFVTGAVLDVNGGIYG